MLKNTIEQDVESVMKHVHNDQLLTQAEYINRFEESKLLRYPGNTYRTS